MSSWEMRLAAPSPMYPRVTQVELFKGESQEFRATLQALQTTNVFDVIQYVNEGSAKKALEKLKVIC